MDGSVIHVAAGLHLGVTLCGPLLCQQCGVAMYHLGRHGLSCKRAKVVFQDVLQ